MDIKKIQNRLLEMAIDTTTILEKHNIPYMIIFGTLLGAVRHQGFIPWDDDFDIFLFDDSYDEAIKHLKNELNENFFVEDKTIEPNYFHAWNRVKDKKTIAKCCFYEHDNIYHNKGLIVDLFRIKKLKFSELQLYRAKEYLSYLERRKKLNIIDEDVYNTKTLELKQKIKVESAKTIDNNDFELLGMSLIEEKMFLEDVFPLKKYKFENTEFYGPNNAHNILTQHFGDYMKLPPENERKSHYDSVKFL